MRLLVAFCRNISKKEYRATLAGSQIAPGEGPAGELMTQPPRRPNGPEIPATAGYIASMADELARLAKSHDLVALAYILDMARMEADQVAKGWSAGDAEPG